MKLHRLAALLSLIAFVFTTSGLAAYAHDRTEHASPITQNSPDNSGQNQLPDKSGRHHHDQCPTCQSLGGLVKNVVFLAIVSIVVDSAPIRPDVPLSTIIGSLDICPTPITSRGPPDR